jgi:hypothetical protein
MPETLETPFVPGCPSLADDLRRRPELEIREIWAIVTSTVEERPPVERKNPMKKIMMVAACAVAMGAFVLSASAASCGSCGGGKGKKAQGGNCGGTNQAEQAQGGVAK